MNRAKQLVKLKRKAFKLWSEKVRSVGHCELCGRKYKELNEKGRPVILNAHHVIPREIKALAWDILNGVSLCQNCHKYNLRVSPHKNGLIFFAWFIKTYPYRYQYLLNNWEKTVDLSIEYLEAKIRELEQ